MDTDQPERHDAANCCGESTSPSTPPTQGQQTGKRKRRLRKPFARLSVKQRDANRRERFRADKLRNAFLSLNLKLMASCPQYHPTEGLDTGTVSDEVTGDVGTDDARHTDDTAKLNKETTMSCQSCSSSRPEDGGLSAVGSDQDITCWSQITILNAARSYIQHLECLLANGHRHGDAKPITCCGAEATADCTLSSSAATSDCKSIPKEANSPESGNEMTISLSVKQRKRNVRQQRLAFALTGHSASRRRKWQEEQGLTTSSASSSSESTSICRRSNLTDVESNSRQPTMKQEANDSLEFPEDHRSEPVPELQSLAGELEAAAALMQLRHFTPQLAKHDTAIKQDVPSKLPLLQSLATLTEHTLPEVAMTAATGQTGNTVPAAASLSSTVTSQPSPVTQSIPNAPPTSHGQSTSKGKGRAKGRTPRAPKGPRLSYSSAQLSAAAMPRHVGNPCKGNSFPPQLQIARNAIPSPDSLPPDTPVAVSLASITPSYTHYMTGPSYPRVLPSSVAPPYFVYVADAAQSHMHPAHLSPYAGYQTQVMLQPAHATTPAASPPLL